jgi:peptidoglycan-associated lipoprotein
MRSLRLSFLAALWLTTLAGCAPKYPKCNNDKDCHEKEYCINGLCQECRDDHDCANGQKCNAGRCETRGGAAACTNDDQCPPGQSCIDGACKPCTSDSECGEGGKCNAGRCQRAAGGVAGGGGPPPSCRLEPVYFGFNESSLNSDATTSLDRNAECIRKSAHAVTLTGRTDPRGTEEYNLALSDRRAQTVRDRLGRLGVTTPVKTVARGEMDAAGKEESGWAKDRRVDFQW